MIEFSSVQNFILTVLAILVIVSLGGAIYAFLYGIFQFIFSHGDPEKKKKARNAIRFMIIGIALTIMLLFFFQYIFKWLGVQDYEAYAPKEIFERVTELLNGMFSFGRSTINGTSAGGDFYTPETSTISDYEL